VSDEVSPTEKRAQSQNVERDGQHRRPSSSKSNFTVPIGRVAGRLALAFSLVIALLIAVGDLGVHRMDQINADLQDIMGREWVKLRLAGEAVTYSNRNSDITMQIFLFTDQEKIKSLLAVRAENIRRISTLIASLEGLSESPE
jgi:hypothetical protein